MSEEIQQIVFKDRQEKAKTFAYGIMKSMDDAAVDLTMDDVFVVWFSKTLQNWKALVSASYPKAPYIELTYNGDKMETYADVYKKIENCIFPD